MTIALRRGRGGPSTQLIYAGWHDRLSFRHLVSADVSRTGSTLRKRWTYPITQSHRPAPTDGVVKEFLTHATNRIGQKRLRESLWYAGNNGAGMVRIGKGRFRPTLLYH
jgi:hypothetical protein